MRKNKLMGKNYQIVVVAEGAKIGGTKVFKEEMTKQANLLGGIAETIMKQIKDKVGEEFEMRHVILGHVQRGGSPNSEDRILAQRFGESAVQAVINKEFGKMVALKGDEIILADIKSAVEKIKSVDDNFHLVKTARSMGISFGDK